MDKRLKASQSSFKLTSYEKVAHQRVLKVKRETLKEHISKKRSGVEAEQLYISSLTFLRYIYISLAILVLFFLPFVLFLRRHAADGRKDAGRSYRTKSSLFPTTLSSFWMFFSKSFTLTRRQTASTPSRHSLCPPQVEIEPEATLTNRTQKRTARPEVRRTCFKIKARHLLFTAWESFNLFYLVIGLILLIVNQNDALKC